MPHACCLLLAASLLQALRWRLVHSTDRRAVLSAWVEADLLRVNAPQHEQVMGGPSLPV
jgi:hypothetical protein